MRENLYDCRRTKGGAGGFGIKAQFPRDKVEKWKSLIPIMKRALNNKKGAVLKVDKLYIVGTLYEGEAEAGSDDEDDTGGTGRYSDRGW